MKGHETLPVAGTETKLNPEVYNVSYEKATHALIQVQGGDVVYRTDGGPVAPATALMAVQGAIITLMNFNEVKLFAAVAAAGTPILQIDYR